MGAAIEPRGAEDGSDPAQRAPVVERLLRALRFSRLGLALVALAVGVGAGFGRGGLSLVDLRLHLGGDRSRAVRSAGPGSERPPAWVGVWFLLVVPVIGGLLYGPLVQRFAPRPAVTACRR